MKLVPVRALLPVVLGLSVVGCRDEPPPRDLGAPHDMGASTDLQVAPRDLAGSSGDMATKPGDMAMPPRDMAAPGDMKSPGDLATPGDLSTTPGDMASPPGDMTIPGGDMGLPDDMMVPGDMMAPGDMTLPPVDMATPPADLGGADMVPPTAPTEFIVLRVGDGSAALNNAATAAFLERRKVSDGSAVGAAFALPTMVSGSNRRLTLGGTATAEGALNRSADGHYLLLGGYDAAVGTASVSGSMSATVNRVIARLDAAGTLNSSTAGDFFSANSLRGVASTDGSALWAAGASGIVYTTLGSAAMPTALVTVNIRGVQIFAGQLYASSGATTNHGLNQVGTGTPMGTAMATLLSGFSADPMSSPYGFLALDRDGMSGIDVIYVADDRPIASGGGIQRWTLKGATWTLDGTIKKGLTAGARGLAGFLSGANVVLLATTAEPAARVVSYVDDGTALDMLAAKALATAPTNTAYRGVALAPQ